MVKGPGRPEKYQREESLTEKIRKIAKKRKGTGAIPRDNIKQTKIMKN